MLSVNGVSYVSGGRALLREVDFVLEPGELLAIVGPNGAGKSTLLKTLVGDLTPSAGTICLDGVTLDSWTPLQQARRRAILPQASSLAFPFRAYEVALMGRNPHDTGASYDEQVSFAALEQSGVSHLSEREYPTLSGGEQQRVQVARVLSQIWDAPSSGNRYLLLDEPTNNLDLAHQHHCLHIAKSMSRQGAGVLAVLHDLNLAAQYADRVLILCQGQVVAAGSPETVLTTDTLCRTFDTPVMVTRHPCFDCPLIVSAMGEAV